MWTVSKAENVLVNILGDNFSGCGGVGLRWLLGAREIGEELDLQIRVAGDTGENGHELGKSGELAHEGVVNRRSGWNYWSLEKE